MKLASRIFYLLLTTTSLAFGQTVAVNGVDNDGYIGVYEINDQHYWWLCIEPVTTPAAIAGEGFFAEQTSLLSGWDQQNTERQLEYSNSLQAQAALSKQVSVMQYVLDTYLPITALTTPGQVLEGSENADFYESNNDFYNSMYAVQHFLTEMYGKPEHTDFTDLADFGDRWLEESDFSASGIARSDLYQEILADVALKDGDVNFFNNYLVENDYYIANTLFGEASPDNWQDALIIVAPVPEPSGALLIACCGLAMMLRRWRKLA
ncbi:putative secreted protein with PEP-CTERM sorting signal [Prosthecobacter fusiformis]|uniref:Putative secreted protein with PEP-CTERM sorting signal n=1 Tax=Prosthecobacter fusiformis TaxID=48464 RepID=A0A4R7S812_9BACT|nr:hypothetical protein [Prosthecobacter fusiformis]TDU73407.1 putative secreted protein with PEP-CTERM sorting signal [Prosthecobacter fusiformis]